MTIYDAIDEFKRIRPFSLVPAQAFLDTLAPMVQEQLVAGIYIGKDHIHKSPLTPGEEVSRFYTDHLPRDKYADVLAKHGNDAIIHLDKMVQCAEASGFDFGNL
ncbi:hypothetical protein FSO04_18810 [Paraburkholderia madseniana]|uniref:Uncharacterized protein n=1 Tax=Paraburkholderia madseniana TaxID=2599607 RepID=A0A6N6WEB8_9BURK|nr:hypothetical protein [Paraburkholderia madseniana]KAE8758441.1 hypothetical protein FSO04_18810 [Paraburkholderia madseniana]